MFTKFVKNNEGRYENHDDLIIYDNNPGTDVYEGISGYTTIVPLRVSQTHEEALSKLKI